MAPHARALQCVVAVTGFIFMATVSGCSDHNPDNTAPPPISVGKSYFLASYGSDLPHIWRVTTLSNGVFCDEQILTGSLAFGSGNTVTETISSAALCNDGSSRDAITATATGLYSLSGDRLTLYLHGTLVEQGAGDFKQSAVLDGNRLKIEQTTSYTSLGTSLDPTVQEYRLIP